MSEPVGIVVRATARVERGTATECACGGELAELFDAAAFLFGQRIILGWRCAVCGKEYA